MLILLRLINHDYNINRNKSKLKLDGKYNLFVNIMCSNRYTSWPSLSRLEVMSPCSHCVHSRSSGVETLSYISGVMSGAQSSASSWSRGTSLSGRFDRVRQATRLSFGSPPPPLLKAFGRQADRHTDFRDRTKYTRQKDFWVYVIWYLVRLHAKRTEFKFFINSM